MQKVLYVLYQLYSSNMGAFNPSALLPGIVPQIADGLAESNPANTAERQSGQHSREAIWPTRQRGNPANTAERQSGQYSREAIPDATGPARRRL